MTVSLTTPERILQWILRILGSSSLLAVFCVAMPYSWMNSIHEGLGMGELPAEPIVGYLARSTSAFYAIMGGLGWMISFDLRRHRIVACYIGLVIAVFGLVLIPIDFMEGLPLFWSLWEGPFNMVAGLAILWLGCRISPDFSRRNPG